MLNNRLNLTWRFSILVLVFIFALVVLMVSIPSTAHASNPGGSIVGAIRWDGYTGDAVTFKDDPIYGGDPNLEYVGLQTERAMSPGKYHFRIPFYSSELSENSCIFRNTTQSGMDQEIAYAKNAKIDYWAFNWYRQGSGLDTARNLYLSSAYKNDVKWCPILTWQHFDNSQNSLLVNYMKESNYQKVLGGRPLVYIFYYNLSRSTLDSLRQECANQGVPNPYVVYMNFDAASAAAGANDVGADAISSYACPTLNGTAYSAAASNEQTQWNNYKNTGKKIVPFVTTGWDTRPYHDNPAGFYSDPGIDGWEQYASPQEIGNQLQDSLDWTYGNPTAVDANTVIMYAWNEFTEGGWLVPSLYFGADRLNAAASVLGGSQQTVSSPPSLGSNIAIGGTATASSEESSTYSAAKTIDGNMGTRWKAAPGAGAGSWLQLNFASNTFNKVVIREQTWQSIQNFRIQYYNGSSWVDLYTGTFAGVYCPVSFNAVTASNVRIYIDSTYMGGTPSIDEIEVHYIPGLDPSLVHEWRFEGSQIDNYGGSHGALKNHAAFSSSGKTGQALQLDGIDDYMYVPDANNLDGYSQFTISLWVNMTQPPNQNYVPIGKDIIPDPAYRVCIGSGGTSGHFAIATANNGWYTAGTTAYFNTPLSSGTWYHIVGTYDGSYVRVYVNGSLAGTGSQAISGLLRSSASELHFGKSGFSTIDYFNGKIDEARIYKRALSSSEVTDLYNYYTGGPAPASFVTSLTTGGLRNDYGNYVGMKITVGGSDITVKELGRYYVSGNNCTHTLKIVRASDGVDMGSVSINMGAGTADSLGYKYATLSSPVTLAANTSYYIVSLETAGGDQWYGTVGGMPSLTTTSAAAVNSAVYWHTGYNSWTPYGSSGNCYVPLNFKY